MPKQKQEKLQVTLKPTLKIKLETKAELVGIKPVEYVRSLIIEDLKKDLK